MYSPLVCILRTSYGQNIRWTESRIRSFNPHFPLTRKRLYALVSGRKLNVNKTLTGVQYVQYIPCFQGGISIPLKQEYTDEITFV